MKFHTYHHALDITDGLTGLQDITKWILNNYPIFGENLPYDQKLHYHKIYTNVNTTLTNYLFFKKHDRKWYIVKEEWEAYQKSGKRKQKVTSFEFGKRTGKKKSKE